MRLQSAPHLWCSIRVQEVEVWQEGGEAGSFGSEAASLWPAINIRHWCEISKSVFWWDQSDMGLCNKSIHPWAETVSQGVPWLIFGFRARSSGTRRMDTMKQCEDVADSVTEPWKQTCHPGRHAFQASAAVFRNTLNKSPFHWQVHNEITHRDSVKSGPERRQVESGRRQRRGAEEGMNQEWEGERRGRHSDRKLDNSIMMRLLLLLLLQI